MTRETILQLLESVQAGYDDPVGRLRELGRSCPTKTQGSPASIIIARCGWDCLR